MNRHVVRWIVIPVLILPTFTWAAGEAPKPAAAAPDQDCSALYHAKNYVKAKDVCAAASDKGDLQARFLLGRLYEEGDGVGKDQKMAAQLYISAAEAGHAASMQRLSGAYYRGWGVEKDDAKAVHWLQQAAKNGNYRAQKQLAVGYEWGLGGLPKDAKLAQEWRDRAEKSKKQN